MTKILIIGFALSLVASAIMVAMQPSDYKVTRAITINAPIEKIYTQIYNLHNWQSWSPWAELDPNMQSDFSGKKQGIGAILSWNSKRPDVGKGSMEIIDAKPNQLVKFALKFQAPLKGESYAEFNFAHLDDKTIVTWSTYGKKNFIAKAIGLIMDCDKMIGQQFEKGLNNLKTLLTRSSS